MTTEQNDDFEEESFELANQDYDKWCGENGHGPNLENLVIRGNAGEKLKGILNTGHQDVAGYRNDALVRIHRAGIAGFELPEDTVLHFDFSAMPSMRVKVPEGKAMMNGREVSTSFSVPKVPADVLDTIFNGSGWRIDPSLKREPKPDPLGHLWGMPVHTHPDVETPMLISQRDICAFFDVPESIITNKPTKRKDAMSTRRTLEAMISTFSEKLEKLNRFPKEENYPIGTLIGFDARFDGEGSKIYHYAGVKTEKGWFITGRDAHRPFTWDELVSHWAEDLGAEITALVVCSEVSELIEPVDLGDAYIDEDGEDA